MLIAEIADISSLPLTEGEISLLTYLSKIDTDDEVQVILPPSQRPQGDIKLCGGDYMGNFTSMLDTHSAYIKLLERRHLIVYTLRSKFPGQTYMSVTVFKEDFYKFPELDELSMQIALGTL